MNILEYIEKNSLEIRNCITRYIGYIISATIVSGVIGTSVFNKKESLENSLIIITIAMIIVTFLFKIIWYKFKSHNKFEGFKFLISHETDYIHKNKLRKENIFREKFREYLKEKLKLNEKDLKYLNAEEDNKKRSYEIIQKTNLYIKYYKSFISEKKHKFNDLNSFNIALSRRNDAYVLNNSLDHEKLKIKLLDSGVKSQFVFSTSEKHYDHIKIDNYDSKFFSKIIWPIYGVKEKQNMISYFKNLFLSLKTLFLQKMKMPHDYFGIDNKYTTIGWRYPRLITRIAFLSILGIYILFILKLYRGYSIDYTYFHSTLNFKKLFFDKDSFAFLLLITNTGIILYWIDRFIANINQLIWGRDSIEGNSWQFFFYRVQYLNRVYNIIPIYFSRNFSRFFKTNLIIRFINDNDNGELNKIKNIINTSTEDKIISREKEVFGEDINFNKEFYITQAKGYYSNLKDYKSFNDYQRVIHNLIKEKSKIYYKTTYNNGYK